MQENNSFENIDSSVYFFLMNKFQKQNKILVKKNNFKYKRYIF